MILEHFLEITARSLSSKLRPRDREPLLVALDLPEGPLWRIAELFPAFVSGRAVTVERFLPKSFIRTFPWAYQPSLQIFLNELGVGDRVLGAASGKALAFPVGPASLRGGLNVPAATFRQIGLDEHFESARSLAGVLLRIDNGFQEILAGAKHLIERGVPVILWSDNMANHSPATNSAAENLIRETAGTCFSLRPDNEVHRLEFPQASREADGPYFALCNMEINELQPSRQQVTVQQTKPFCSIMGEKALLRVWPLRPGRHLIEVALHQQLLDHFNLDAFTEQGCIRINDVGLWPFTREFDIDDMETGATLHLRFTQGDRAMNVTERNRLFARTQVRLHFRSPDHRQPG